MMLKFLTDKGFNSVANGAEKQLILINIIVEWNCQHRAHFSRVTLPSAGFVNVAP